MDEPLQPAQLEEAVDSAGFELLWTEYTVLGTLSSAQQADGQLWPVISVPATQQSFLLFPGEDDGERESYARLGEWLDEPERTFRVRGRVHAHVAASPALTVREFYAQ